MWNRLSAWFGPALAAPPSEWAPPPPPPASSPAAVREDSQPKPQPQPQPSTTAPQSAVAPKRTSLPTLSQYIIDAYIDLVRGGVLENGAALEVYNQGQRMLFAQPEQDPLGVLTTTLFFLRFHDIVDLSWKSRQSAAVTLTTFHKLCTSQRSLRSLLTVERVIRRFLLPKEEAVVRNLDALVHNHVDLECRLAWQCDLLHFWQTSPMAGVEERLWELLNAGHLTESAVIMVRGIVFYFLANALLDGHYAKHFEIYSVYDMGCAVVGLAILCARRAWHDIDHCSDLTGRHRRCAITLLGVTRRTQAHRIASYSDSTYKLSTGTCVTPANLRLVAASLASAEPPPPATAAPAAP